MLNFERIELLGFKSFPEKIKIDLLDGITAIVGPNGCGKSNIADAIKWVLGEQSAKTLRGSSMQDVIFNGTALRKKLSYCEVSLYFNNENNLFPSKPHSQVVITRKLFRSGESEYMINKQTCRLKDIIQTLHECGVSKNGYTVIEQGKVSQILDSKPEDRRAIFEEAVGISKTKQDRKESMAKLARTEDNISRTDDILAERKKQLDPLARQAEKTRAHRKLSEDLKYQEVNTYVYKYETANDTKNGILETINGYDEALSVHKKDFEDVSLSRDNHQNEINEADAKLRIINEKITEKAVINERRINEDNRARDRIAYFVQENEKYKNEIEEGETQKVDNLKNIEFNKKLINESNKKIKDLNKRSRELNVEIDRITDEMSSKEKNAFNAQSKVLESVESLADINKNIGALSSEENVITSQQKEIVEKVNSLVEKYGYYEKELDLAKEELKKNEEIITSNKDKIKSLEGSISSSNEFIAKLDNEISQLKNKISIEEARLNFQQSLKDNFEGFGYTVKNLLRQAQIDKELGRRVKGTVANIITTEKTYEYAIETVLGATLQNIITETGSDAEYIISYLKSNNGGRVTILPVNSIKRRENTYEINEAVGEIGAIGMATDLVKYDSYYENVVFYILGNTLIVNDITNARKIGEKYNYAFRILTLDGDIVSQNGTYSGGSKKTSGEANLLSVERRINELTEFLTGARVELEKKEKAREDLLQTLNEEVSELDRLNEESQEAKQQLGVLREKVTGCEEMISSINAEIESNKDQIAVIVTRLREIKSEYTNIEEGNTKIKQQKESAEESQKAEREKHLALQQEKEKLVSERNDVLNSIAVLNSDISIANANIQRLTEENASIDDKNKHRQELIENNIKIVDNIKQELEKKNLTADELKELEDLKKERDSFDERKIELNRLLALDNKNRDDIQAQIDQVIEKKNAQEVKLANVDSELQYMSEKIFTDYQMDYESCAKIKDENYDISTSQEKISSLNEQIRKLGSINPSAIEEYNELSESYNELLEQREDLVKAKESLQTVISDLTKEMDLTFNKGFETIRSHFSRVFKELFVGGRADLIIEESTTDDPLDAGIEIVAEPPGKKLQKISLLSGGEKTLTAIAILFAILKSRPMPFVVLDEIEAALDDDNVRRFSQYLAKFSKETQFICISHKKITMEYADGLFGITMPEKGVSSVVSVKLSDAIKMEGVN